MVHRIAEARAAGEPERAETAYRSALALWRGTALADVDSPAIRHAAAVLDEEHVQVKEECIEIELSLGRARELLPELQHLTRRHQYREKLHGAYMLVLNRTGRYADALAAYGTSASCCATSSASNRDRSCRTFTKRSSTET